MHDLLPKENVLFVHRLIVMKMAEQPVVVLCPVFDLLEEVRQVIRHIVSGKLEGNAGGCAVGEDVVHRPAVGVQVSSGLCIFLLRG